MVLKDLVRSIEKLSDLNAMHCVVKELGFY